MRYHQPQGHFRHFTTQLRESTQNNQDWQTSSLFKQLILQISSLSQNLNSQKNEIQNNGNKPGHTRPRARARRTSIRGDVRIPGGLKDQLAVLVIGLAAAVASNHGSRANSQRSHLRYIFLDYENKFRLISFKCEWLQPKMFPWVWIRMQNYRWTRRPDQTCVVMSN